MEQYELNLRGRDELVDYPAPEDSEPGDSVYDERGIGCPTPEDGDPEN